MWRMSSEHRSQRVYAEWFGQHIGETGCAQRRVRRTIVVGGCRQRDRGLRRACLRADSRQYLGTAEVRHVCVEQEHVVGGRVRVIERQRAIRGLADSVAEHIERLGKKTQAEWI